MALHERVHVARRYRRAVRIDTDFGDPAALEGFICPGSSGEALGTMARHVLESGQGAFTWTGPYGGGKSSLAVVLGTMLNGSTSHRREAEAILGETISELLVQALPPRRRGWRVLPVSGRRDEPAQVIGEAVEAAGFVTAKGSARRWTEKRVLDTLADVAALNPRAAGGLVVFIDEMGKFLEAAARDGADIHLFQQLAELSSRSDGRLIVIGILHQAFDEYAHRLSRELRDEWSKIQGRFVDLAINVSGDEQIELLARAIESDRRIKAPSRVAKGVARLLQGRRSADFASILEDCWPLHPATACLLGPLSRRRFGQNQRSLFGFLNSAEPNGFRDFLRGASSAELYGPDRLWDYLRINLEPSILVSPDGHRWALAADALARCEAMGGEALHLRLLKVIALADLLKERSGLAASRDLLGFALPNQADEDIDAALDDLRRWSLIVFRKFSGAWSIFEGSDFDIDSAVGKALEEVDGTDVSVLHELASLQPIVAKRHYHETGALRWFDVGVVALADLEAAVAGYSPRNGAIGQFLLVVPTQNEPTQKAKRLCRKVTSPSLDRDIVVGLSPSTWSIPALVLELVALEHVRDQSPQLQGDRVARIEILARISETRTRIESDVARAFDTASWYRSGARAEPLSRGGLSALASSLADFRFGSAPRIHNELLGRTRPSSNAVAARNNLLRRMVLHEHEPRLGIEGFPAEGGLFVSVLESTGLHRETAEGLRFVAPPSGVRDSGNLAPIWGVATRFLRGNAARAVPISELYDVWREPPFGVKEGLLSVLSVAFLLSQRNSLAFYRRGVFQPELTDLDVDYLVQNPLDIQVRWMDLSGVSRRLLSELAEVVRDLDEGSDLRCLEPIDVARGLVAIHDRLPRWTGRTQRLSRDTLRIRQLFKQAKDPNRLIFDDMPALLQNTTDTDKKSARRIADRVRTGLGELCQAQPAMLARLREVLLAELHVPNVSASMLAELRERATNVRELGGDHRLEAFIVRLSRFAGSDSDMEGLAGMAANKPVHAWVDPDVDRATVELADLAQRFIRAEAFARVKGRRDKRHAMAVVVGLEGRPTPIHDEFYISDRERSSVDSIVERVVDAVLATGENRRNVVLAALAETSARYLGVGNGSRPRSATKRRRKSS